MISGFEVYNIFNSIKRHFTMEEFDAIKYKFQINGKQETFDKRKDKYFFERVSNKYGNRNEILRFLLANLVYDPNMWIEQCNHENFLDWKRRVEGMTFSFKGDCKTLVKKFKDHKQIFKGNPPAILNEYLGGRVSLETLVIFNEINEVIDNFKDESGLFSEVKLVVRKYAPFLNIDKVKMANVARDVFTGENKL